MNVGAYGNNLYFGTGLNGAGFDLSAYTELTLEFTRSDNTTLTVTTANGVTLGASPLSVPGGNTYNTHQYVSYVFTQGQVTVPGAWKVRLVYDDATASPPVHLPSDVGVFTVGA